MRIAVGPLLYLWPREAVFDFYAEVAALPVDIVYLGETVCSKRRALRLADWIEIAARLESTGKEVVLSTLALLEAESELKTLRQIVGNGHYAIEANDVAAVRMAADADVPFVVGPHLNTYNPGTLALFAELSAVRWVMPVELSRDALAVMQQERPAGMQTEVFGFGRLPLAFSARCFTARTHGLAKDDCQLRCGDYPEGSIMRTQEGASFLNINGVQTQSASVSNLLAEVPEMISIGVDVVRLSPQQPKLLAAAVLAFRAGIEGRDDDKVLAGLRDLQPDGDFCNGYWHGKPGMQWMGAPAPVGNEFSA